MGRRLFSFLLLVVFAGSAQAAEPVRVMVLDGPIDFSHPALQESVWRNPDEIPSNRFDDDGNGVMDDVSGWNFHTDTPVLFDPLQIGSEEYPRVLETLRLLSEYEREQLGVLDGIHLLSLLRTVPLPRYVSLIHGTHVAGILARTSDAVALVGATLPQRSLLLPSSTQVADGTRMFSDEEIATEVEYYLGAERRFYRQLASYILASGVRVVNCSFGISEPALRASLRTRHGHLSEEELGRIVEELVDGEAAMLTDFILGLQEVLFVVAAGNEGRDLADGAQLPATLDLGNVITVAALDPELRLAEFSNYGKVDVDLAAPGTTIESTVPGNAQASLSGTSMAVPQVSAVAAAVIAANPALSPVSVIHILNGTVDELPWLTDKVTSGGMLNPARAVNAARHADPSQAMGTAVEAAFREVPASIPEPPSPRQKRLNASRVVETVLNLMRR